MFSAALLPRAECAFVHWWGIRTAPRFRLQLGCLEGRARPSGPTAGSYRPVRVAATLFTTAAVGARFRGRQQREVRTEARAASGASAAMAVTAGWSALQEELLAHPTAQALKQRDEERAAGLLPHTDVKVRYFGASRTKPRVLLYRDQAAWCPYCQKVWLLLEAKGVDYTISKVPMRSYGDKPPEFLAKVRGGILPAIEIDGQLMTESLDIMFAIEDGFLDAAKPMFPREPAAREQAVRLMKMERQLFGAWCNYMFRSDRSASEFDSALAEVDAALGQNTASPWFLPVQHPTIVDMQYVSHVERMTASAMYFKGYDIRKRFSNIDAWLSAFEELPYYMASMSDYYTHVMNIPPQYGSPLPSKTAEAKSAMQRLHPQAARLPVDWARDPEPRTKAQAETDELQFGTEAAWALAKNHAAITKFCCRAAGGDVGNWARGNPTKCELSDPYAKSSEDLNGIVSALLCEVATTLLHGPAEQKAPGAALAEAVRRTVATSGIPHQHLESVATCLAYLRDRVGVPRDMSTPAAKLLRAHLGEAIVALRTPAAASM